MGRRSAVPEARLGKRGLSAEDSTMKKLEKSAFRFEQAEKICRAEESRGPSFGQKYSRNIRRSEHENTELQAWKEKLERQSHKSVARQ